MSNSKPYVGLQEVFKAYFFLTFVLMLLSTLTTAILNFNLHVYCWVQVWHAVRVINYNKLNRFWSTTGWLRLTTGLSKVTEWSSSAQFLLFCFRWNTGACSASTPSAGGRIKTQKKTKKKKPTLTLIKDNPQTTQLPIEKNELNHAASD